MSEDVKVTPFRPYLVKAMYEWIIDNNLTPQISVDVNCPNVDLPLQYAQNGVIVLNIGLRAVRDFNFVENEAIAFTTRFGGVSHSVYVPMQAILAIYPREDISLGVFTYPEKAYDNMSDSASTTTKKNTSSILEVVDSEQADTKDKEPIKDSKKEGSSSTPSKKPTLEIVE